MFDTYGRNIGIYIERFDKALVNFNLDDVEYAFDKWFEVGKKLPIPANIIEIIDARHRENRPPPPEHRYLPEPEPPPKYSALTDEKKKEVDAWLLEAKRILKSAGQGN